LGVALPRVRIAVSACLLGQQVRFDGGHKRDDFVVDALGRLADLLPVCPEVALELGVPRRPIRLVGDPRRPRVLVTGDEHLDFTEALERFAGLQAAMLRESSGCILKSHSPSCGLRGVPVYRSKTGAVIGEGAGGFARILTKARPDLPVEDEVRLRDPSLRESFLTRAYVYSRWLALASTRIDADGLMRFHQDHRFLLIARPDKDVDLLHRLSAVPEGSDSGVHGDRYIRELMRTLSTPVDRSGHLRALRGILDELAPDLGKGGEARLAGMIDAYRRGEVPWMVPASAMRHRVGDDPARRTAYLRYLQPFPDELFLPDAR